MGMKIDTMAKSQLGMGWEAQGGKMTVSHAQVSLVETSKGVRMPYRLKGLVPPCIPWQGSAISREGRAAKAALGVDFWKGVPFRCARSVSPLPPHVSYLPVGFLTRLRKAWGWKKVISAPTPFSKWERGDERGGWNCGWRREVGLLYTYLAKYRHWHILVQLAVHFKYKNLHHKLTLSFRSC